MPALDNIFYWLHDSRGICFERESYDTGRYSRTRWPSSSASHWTRLAFRPIGCLITRSSLWRSRMLNMLVSFWLAVYDLSSWIARHDKYRKQWQPAPRTQIPRVRTPGGGEGVYMRHWPGVGLVLGRRRRRRWANVSPTSDRCLMLC